MNIKKLLCYCTIIFLAFSCKKHEDKSPTTEIEEKEEITTNDGEIVDQFADIKVLRYQIPGWNKLTLKEQKLVYYLTQAGISGRDIMWDQNYRHNLAIRKALENIYTNYTGDKTSKDWKAFEV